MESFSLQKTLRKPISFDCYVIITHTHTYLDIFLIMDAYRGMEQMIKTQKDSIAELEAKIAANMCEIQKVSNRLWLWSL